MMCPGRLELLAESLRLVPHVADSLFDSFFHRSDGLLTKSRVGVKHFGNNDQLLFFLQSINDAEFGFD